MPSGKKYLVVSLPTNGLDCRRYLRATGRVSHDREVHQDRNAHFAGP
ncbi:Uncharacterised protein [Mycobacterium tuberculosis]|uniref:Uncharacterized protein n=1 Tax=Mycobacterium tuberculosis TaxID=1773 RepID=A0A916LCV9_MYCTX|nr:Uncharacterised protein [Mycobacterium tuberculosis]COY19356.1 Uncharacterised protein [Mycobacterium tuberculosis]COY83625.1 Uncharacterised protein [Mycobacterium tuberculosis]